MEKETSFEKFTLSQLGEHLNLITPDTSDDIAPTPEIVDDNSIPCDRIDSEGEDIVEDDAENSGTESDVGSSSSAESYSLMKSRLEEVDEVDLELECQAVSESARLFSSQTSLMSRVENNPYKISDSLVKVENDNNENCSCPHVITPKYPYGYSPAMGNRGIVLRPIPSVNDAGESIFTRAPNFRTPGGYKPPLFNKKSRNLTEEELLEELKNMYLEPELPDPQIGEDDEFIANIPSVPVVLSHIPKFNFTNGAPVQFGSGKPMLKRKIIKTVQNSLSEINEIVSQPTFPPQPSKPLEDVKIEEIVVKEKEEIPSTETLSELLNSMNLSPLPVKSEVNNFQQPPKFGCLPRKKNKTRMKGNLASDLNNVWKDLQDTRAKMNQEIEFTNVNLSTNALNSSLLKDLNIGQSTSNEVVQYNGRVNEESDSVCVNDLLYEADIHPFEFDEIFQQLVDFEISDEEEMTEERALAEALDEARVSEWARSGASFYTEKFQEEKMKRQDCEDEIRKLRSELSEVKGKNENLEKALGKKDSVISKITRAFEQISIKWKAHEATSRNLIAKLQSDQAELVNSVLENKEKVLHYEGELKKALEVGQEYKTKLSEFEMEKEKEILNLTNSFQTKLKETEESSLKSEAEKMELKDNILQLQNTSEEERTLKNKLQFENEELKIKIQDHIENDLQKEVDILDSELKSQEVELKHVISLLKEKDVEISLKVKEESDKLNTYYNEKLQEILTEQSKNMHEAECELLNKQKKLIGEIEIQHAKRSLDLQLRCKREVESIKSTLEIEIDALRGDNIAKQKQISELSDFHIKEGKE